MKNRLALVPTGSLQRSLFAGRTVLSLGVQRLVFRARSAFSDATLQGERDALHHKKMARQLFSALSQLRGTALKLAQLLAADDSLLTPVYAAKLREAYHRVPSINRYLVRKCIFQELGRSPEDLFRTFSPDPFAAASLGQTHAATTHSGTALAVKIQYPGIHDTVASDLKLAKLMALPLIRNRFLTRLLTEIETTLLEEVDYTIEIKNQLEFFNCFCATESSKFVIPRPYQEHSSHRVLAMDFLAGKHLTEWLSAGASRDEINHYAELMFEFFCTGFFRHALVHVDPSEGNFLLMSDGRLGILDFGAVKRVRPQVIDLFRALWTNPAELPSRSLWTQYQALGAEIDLVNQDEAEEFSKVLIDPYRQWIWRAIGVEQFDFAVWPEFATEGLAILAAQTFHPHLQQFTTEFCYIHRTVSGLMQIFTRMGAAPRLKNALRRQLKP